VLDATMGIEECVSMTVGSVDPWTIAGSSEGGTAPWGAQQEATDNKEETETVKGRTRLS
jgi:hypothetical protein